MNNNLLIQLFKNDRFMKTTWFNQWISRTPRTLVWQVGLVLSFLITMFTPPVHATSIVDKAKLLGPYVPEEPSAVPFTPDPAFGW
ncbi:MAG TPA: hypothetical protein PK066_13235, partial [Saprospiraceae bacterium]|nr:hypothetical protein [Saprospiraceae bacterium]